MGNQMIDDDDDAFDDDDDTFDDDDDDAFSTSAWLLVGITGSVHGVLELDDGRLAFTIEERSVFNVPLSEVRDVKFPWYYFGGGIKFRIGADRYRLSFVLPTGQGGDIGDIGEGRRAGKAWKSALGFQTDS